MDMDTVVECKDTNMAKAKAMDTAMKTDKSRRNETESTRLAHTDSKCPV
jgi:hypothetical protein